MATPKNFMNPPVPITSLTPEQVRQLTPEQQDTLGALEAARIRRRQELVVQARSYRGRLMFPVIIALGLLVLVPLGLFYRNLVPTPAWTVAGMFAFLVILQFHVSGLNRRLDALVSLLETDEKL